MWVGFIYTVVIKVLWGPRETRVSKKGVKPLFLDFFMVNWKELHINNLEELLPKCKATSSPDK